MDESFYNAKGSMSDEQYHIMRMNGMSPSGLPMPAETDDMPTEAQMDAFQRGEQAHERGSPLDANPYGEFDDRRDFWMFGWQSADNKPHRVGASGCPLTPP